MSRQASDTTRRSASPAGTATREHTLKARTALIDRIPKPVFAIGLDRLIYTCNRAGKAMLADPVSPLRSHNGRLRCNDSAIDNAIAFQAFAVTQWPDLSFADQYAAVSPSMRSQWVAVSVSCLQSPDPKNDPPGIRCLLLTVHPVLVHGQIDAALLQAALGLSRAEARVCALIYAGLNLRDAGLKMDISQSTAKTHLQSAFGKTRVSKQTELVKLIASLV